MKIKKLVQLSLTLVLIGELLLLTHREPITGGDLVENFLQAVPARAQVSTPSKVYMPFMVRRYPIIQPFGMEPNANLANSTVLNLVKDLDARWARLGMRVSWRELQPDAGGPIQWQNLAGFENELRAAVSAGIDPVVLIYHSPDWALPVGQSRWCAPIASDKFDDFAAFVSQLVARYSTQEFGVKNWELGNEIDVDPSLVPPDSGFGCWGDRNDPYYGGRYYGQMLKVVTPAIRAQSQDARVWLGGLLLDRPNSPGSSGYPERFLEGVLLAGGAPYFDVIPYHWYPSYFPYAPCQACNQERIDYDIYGNSYWTPWGGGSAGKAQFIKSVLAKYSVTKLLSLNETALGCVDNLFPGGCEPSPDEPFLQAQADFIVRTSLRAIQAGNSSYIWFTLQDEWRFTGLTNSALAKKPVYTAYQTLIDQYGYGIFRGAVTYGTGIEAYAIEGDDRTVHVVWTVDDEVGRTIQVPVGKLQAIYTRDGVSLPLPNPSGGYYILNVSFSPTYFQLKK